LKKTSFVFCVLLLFCVGFAFSQQAATEIPPNLIFAVDKNGSTYEGRSLEFEPGHWVEASTNSFDKGLREAMAGMDVTFSYEFSTGGKVLAVHSFPRKMDLSGGFFKFNILPNPDSPPDPPLRKDWSGNLAKALSALPSGKHPIDVRGFVELDGGKAMVLRGTITYKNAGGNGALASIASKIDALSSAPGAVKPAATSSKAPSGVAAYFSDSPKEGAAARDSFKAGDYIYAHVKFEKPILSHIGSVDSDMTYITLYMDENGKELEYYSFGIRFANLSKDNSAGKKGYLVIPVVNDPANGVTVLKNTLFNTIMPKTLAGLSVGKHNLSFRVVPSSPKDEANPTLASAKLSFEMTAQGKAALLKNADESFKSMATKGGENVLSGIQVTLKDGLKIKSQENVVVTETSKGIFEGDDFYIGIIKQGKRFGSVYTTVGGVRFEIDYDPKGGYLVKRDYNKVVLRIGRDAVVLDGANKAVGKLDTDIEDIQSTDALIELIAGFVHFTTIMR